MTQPRRLTDVILTYSEHIRDRPLTPTDRAGRYAKPLPNYRQYLSLYHNFYVGRDLPPDPAPDAVLVGVNAFVNAGRWVWQCPACRAGGIVEDGELAICAECGGDGQWIRVIMPDNRAEIEKELLRQPGGRHNAPIREWQPGWDMDRLRSRTQKAKEIAAQGVSPRALSVGSVYTWVTGQTLSAGTMNTYVSELLRDLIGRNGVIELEAPLSLENAGDDAYIQLPNGTTGQRPNFGQPGGGNTLGAWRFNTTLDAPEFNLTNTAWQQILTSRLITYETLDDIGDIGTTAGTLADGGHAHDVVLASGATGGITLVNYVRDDEDDSSDVYDIGNWHDATYTQPGTTGAYVTIMTDTITVNDAHDTVALASFLHMGTSDRQDSTDTHGSTAFARIVRKSTGVADVIVVTYNTGFQTIPPDSNRDYWSFRWLLGFLLMDRPSVGSYTYELQVAYSNPSGYDLMPWKPNAARLTIDVLHV